MRFTEIYNNVICFWPEKIEFDDGELTGGDGFLSVKLSTTWNDVEKAVGTENNFNNLMVWSMFGVFHRNAKRLFKSRIYSLHPKDIDKSEFEQEFFKDLNDGSDYYFKELQEYIRK